jgi:hypothetical protein
VNSTSYTVLKMQGITLTAPHSITQAPSTCYISTCYPGKQPDRTNKVEPARRRFTRLPTFIPYNWSIHLNSPSTPPLLRILPPQQTYTSFHTSQLRHISPSASLKCCIIGSSLTDCVTGDSCPCLSLSAKLHQAFLASKNRAEKPVLCLVKLLSQPLAVNKPTPAQPQVFGVGVLQAPLWRQLTGWMRGPWGNIVGHANRVSAVRGCSFAVEKVRLRLGVIQ